MPADPGASRRVFVALWPDAALADEIVPRAARLSLGGRLVAKSRLHLTLFFAGALDADALAGLVDGAARVANESARFSLVVDGVGGFASSRTAWFGVSQPPAGLLGLVDRLACLGGSEADRPARFVPHITVARQTAPPAPARLFPPLIWHVDRFAVVESGADGAPGDYRALASWTLKNSAAQV